MEEERKRLSSASIIYSAPYPKRVGFCRRPQKLRRGQRLLNFNLFTCGKNANKQTWAIQGICEKPRVSHTEDDAQEWTLSGETRELQREIAPPPLCFKRCPCIMYTVRGVRHPRTPTCVGRKLHDSKPCKRLPSKRRRRVSKRDRKGPTRRRSRCVTKGGIDEDVFWRHFCGNHVRWLCITRRRRIPDFLAGNGQPTQQYCTKCDNVLLLRLRRIKAFVLCDDTCTLV